LKIITELKIIKKAPNKVETCGISLKKKIPDMVANTKLRYLIGVTVDTEPLRKDMVKNIFPVDPAIPMAISGNKSCKLGITNVKNKEHAPTAINVNVK
jgi:hypothetical protein